MKVARMSNSKWTVEKKQTTTVGMRVRQEKESCGSGIPER